MELLKSLGVITGSKKDFHEAVKEYGGHALALTLLGQYIANILDGDIRRRDEIQKSSKGKIKEGHHAQRVMEAYVHWLGNSPERDILYIIGLFDRPVKKGTINALKETPAIPGVTDKLQDISGADWQLAISNLRNANLLAKENLQKTETLDCHPLVREFFGEKLRQENPAGWHAAHERLYRYFKDLPEKELPDTIQEMEPLFAAVAHGCKAGLHKEVLKAVYFKRISREHEAYIVKTLSAFGVDLTAVSHFFEVPWSQPAAGLEESDKALAMNWAAYDLRAVGRLQEAIHPMKESLDASIKQESWVDCAKNTGNLSELMLTLGDVPQAVEYARQGITYADQSEDDYEREKIRTIFADGMHQSGDMTEAEKWCREAEEMQKKCNPEYPFLYSLQGYRFCDLLLGQGKYNNVRERAEKTLEWAKKYLGLIEVALDRLSLGRAWMMWELEKTPDEPPQSDRLSRISRAMTYLEQAVEGLRESGNQDDLPRGLLARAECYRHMKEYVKALDDLAEARDIAELGEMKLYLCDYHLETGRLCEAEGKTKDAGEHFRAAKAIVEETGYFRRRKELKELMDNCQLLMVNG